MRGRWFDRARRIALPLALAGLYLALLAGHKGLGVWYPPAVGLPAALLAGLGLAHLLRERDLRARLRAEAPLLLLGGLVLLALGLRLWRRPAVVPATADEGWVVGEVLRMIQQGTYIPSSLRHPSLFLYTELAVSVLRFLTGASANLWTWPTELLPEHLYGWARGAVALAGAATLLPLYRLAEGRFGRRAGLLATLFLGLLPMHLAASGRATPEVPAALLQVLAVWFAFLFLEKSRPALAATAGACAGLAAATHYPAGLVLLVPLLALALRPSPDRWRTLLLLLGAALLAFLLACPAVLFAPDRLVAGLAEAARAYFPPEGRAGTGIRYLLTEGLGYGPALLVLLGGFFWLGRLRREDWLFLSLPMITYLALLLPRTRFPADLVLLSPWLALAAAVGVEGVCRWAERRRPAAQRYLPWLLALLAGGLFVLAVIVAG